MIMPRDLSGASDRKIRCDDCRVMWRIEPVARFACDREAGLLVPVDPLVPLDRDEALDARLCRAETRFRPGLICGAALHRRGRTSNTCVGSLLPTPVAARTGQRSRSAGAAQHA